jgi:hypothetical protein
VVGGIEEEEIGRSKSTFWAFLRIGARAFIEVDGISGEVIVFEVLILVGVLRMESC